MERIIIPFETKSEKEDPAGTIRGYGSIFKVVDSDDDIVCKGAFQNSLAYYKKSGTMPAMYWEHKSANTIGEWNEAFEDEIGLGLVGAIWVGKGIPDSERAYMVTKSKTPKGLSIGFKTIKADFETKNGRKVRLLKDVALREISVVQWPANEDAQILSVKSMLKDVNGEFKSKRDLEETIREMCGLSLRETKALLASGYDGLVKLRDEAKSANGLDFAAELKRLAESMRA